MIYAKIKDQEEQKQLDDALDSSKNKKWYRRLQVIANSAKRFTVKQLSIMFAICEATIRSYIQLYNEGGLDKLVKQPGHPPKIANWTKEQLMEMCPDDFLFVVRDNASSHVTPKLDEFLIGNKDRLCLVPLPTRSPHLNLIERLWHYMRDNITRNHFYATFEELCETWVNWLQTLPFERFVSLMGCQKHFLKVFS